MTDLASILQALPAGTPFTIVSGRIPDGHPQNHLLTPSASESLGLITIIDPATDPSLTEAASDIAQHSTGPLAATAELRPTPLQRLRKLKTDNPRLMLKPKEWARKINHSAREISRAVEAGAVPHTAKEDGRDHGAKLVHVADLEVFFSTIDAVERNRIEPPAWWERVCGPKAWERRSKMQPHTVAA